VNIHRDLSGNAAGISPVTPETVQSTSLSIRQVINTFVPFFGLLYLMYRLLPISYPLALVLAVAAAGLQAACRVP